MTKEKLINEIIKNLMDIPIECQEKILDISDAMAFTNKVVQEKQKQQKSDKQTA